MTVVVLKFKGQKVGEGGGVMARRQQRDDETEGGALSKNS